LNEKKLLIWASPDGRREGTFRVTPDGRRRDRVIQWCDVEPDAPDVRPPGFWMPFWSLGVFESLEEAQRNFKGWPVVKDENWT
jgi:hypothetical protein